MYIHNVESGNHNVDNIIHNVAQNKNEKHVHKTKRVAQVALKTHVCTCA